MAPKRHGKANIQASKPDLPPFLQRMRDQIVANEDVDRRERGERQRKTRANRSSDDLDDDPTVVKISEEDITEEEYKRIKHDLKNNYKTESETNRLEAKPVDIDVETLIQSRNVPLKSIGSSSSKSEKTSHRNQREEASGKKEHIKSNIKTLSYSSDEEDD